MCLKVDKEGKFLSSTKRDPAFVSKGYTYLKDATSAFQTHQQSHCHREAIEVIIVLPKVSTDVGELLSHEHHEEKEKNKKMFLRVLEGIMFLARQGLPFRNLVDEDSVLLSLLSVNCPDLKLWMVKKTNKYTSHDIQNECVKLMAFHILRQLSKDIQENGWYAIMADECTDVSNVEQFTICIRWVNKYLESHESLIRLYKVDSITSDTLVSVIKDTFVRLNVKLTDCRGQCNDGASNSGSRRGIAA